MQIVLHVAMQLQYAYADNNTRLHLTRQQPIHGTNISLENIILMLACPIKGPILWTFSAVLEGRSLKRFLIPIITTTKDKTENVLLMNPYMYTWARVFTVHL